MMTTKNTSATDRRLMDLYESHADGRISRRGFIRGAGAITAAGLSVPAWMLGDLIAHSGR
jgi:hypothetical protein